MIKSLTGLLAALFLAMPTPALADTLVVNVNGITLDERGGVQRFTALRFGPDGKVRALYAGKDKRPKAEYQVDGKGRTLLPGFIDAHLHLIELGMGTLTLDLSATRSLGEAQAAIAHYAARHADRPWIIGYGWDEARWGLGRYPTAAELDSAFAARPVWLTRSGGDAGWANSAALAAAGITAQTPQPTGGRIERLANGAPSGVLVEEARSLVDRAAPSPRAVDRDLALERAQTLLLARGITAVADMSTTVADWQTFRRAGDLGRLRLRIMGYAQGNEAMALIAGPEPTPWLYEDRLRLNGVHLAVDGALGSRAAWLSAPYADQPGERGLPRLNPTQLANLMSRAAMDGFQVAVDATGDRAVASVLEAVEDLGDTYRGDRRWRIEHAQVVRPSDLARFGASRVVASVQPAGQLAALQSVEAKLGAERLAGVAAWRSLAAAGAPLAFGSDAPAGITNAFLAMAAAITREDQGGQPVAGWQAQERIERIAALAAQTSGPAFAGFAERRFGRLAPGMRADFVLVDVDPLLAAPGDLRRGRVFETWINGQRVFAAGEEPDAKGHR